MATINAEVDPLRPWVIINTTGTASWLAGATVMRTDSYGTREVRAEPVGVDGELEAYRLVDMEPALGPCLYTWEDAGRKLVAEADVGAVHRRPTLSLAHRPEVMLELSSVRTYEGPRSSPTIIHDVIDRRLPLATIRPLSGRAGRLEVLARSWSEVRDIEAIVELGRTVHYRESQNPGMDVFMAVTSVSPARIAGDLWTVTINWTEVDAPTQHLQPLPETFGSIRDGYEDFPAVTDAFRSFVAMAAGEAK